MSQHSARGDRGATQLPDAANPVLIEIVRGPMVESIHRGAVCVAGPGGNLLLSLGDVARPVYPRSAIKALQTLPLVESGAADAYRLSAEELAVACASHAGADYHVAAVRGLLAKAGLTEEHLACGVHRPLGGEAASAAIACGGARQVHNNCSGKHAGMLAAARHRGLPLAGYERADHPLQATIRDLITGMSGANLGEAPCAIDGCSLPNWSIPLANLAQTFARFGTGIGMPEFRANAARRLMEACFTAPEFVAGEGRLDTTLLRVLRGEAFVKTGAEGVYCAALPKRGLGLALKIDDGAKRGAEAVLLHVLAGLLPERRSGLSDLIDQPARNWRGIVTGKSSAGAPLRVALAGLARERRAD